MLFQCDLQHEMSLFDHQYRALLCSEDSFDPELPMLNKRAKGGTMILWKIEHDQFIKPLTTSNSALLPILFFPPGHERSIHVAIYLPTSGKEDAFVDAVTDLCQVLDENMHEYPDAHLFIRGDSNVNKKHLNRSAFFSSFCNNQELVRLLIDHPTYHHFMGNGISDSELDVILFTETAPEELLCILCKLESPDHTSHHDALLSSFHLPPKNCTAPEAVDLVAPRILNNRVKIKWTETGIEQYKLCVAGQLSRIRDTWLDSSSSSCISILLESTNSLLSNCARLTNPFTDLSKPFIRRPVKKPQFITRSEKSLLRSHRMLTKAEPSSTRYPQLLQVHQERRRHHNRLIRYRKIQEAYLRDSRIDTIVSARPADAYKSIRAMKNTRIAKLIN